MKRAVKQPSGCSQSSLSSAFSIILLFGNIYWKCACGCAGGRVTTPRRLWPPEELAALSESGGSSFTSGLITCALPALHTCSALAEVELLVSILPDFEEM